MGWSHGKKWTDKEIMQELLDIYAAIQKIPTYKDLKSLKREDILQALRHRGGLRKWQAKLERSLKPQPCGDEGAVRQAKETVETTETQSLTAPLTERNKKPKENKRANRNNRNNKYKEWSKKYRKEKGSRYNYRLSSYCHHNDSHCHHVSSDNLQSSYNLRNDDSSLRNDDSSLRNDSYSLTQEEATIEESSISSSGASYNLRNDDNSYTHDDNSLRKDSYNLTKEQDNRGEEYISSSKKTSDPQDDSYNLRNDDNSYTHDDNSLTKDSYSYAGEGEIMRIDIQSLRKPPRLPSRDSYNLRNDDSSLTHDDNSLTKDSDSLTDNSGFADSINRGKSNNINQVETNAKSKKEDIEKEKSQNHQRDSISAKGTGKKVNYYDLMRKAGLEPDLPVEETMCDLQKGKSSGSLRSYDLKSNLIVDVNNIDSRAITVSFHNTNPSPIERSIEYNCEKYESKVKKEKEKLDKEKKKGLSDRCHLKKDRYDKRQKVMFDHDEIEKTNINPAEIKNTVPRHDENKKNAKSKKDNIPSAENKKLDAAAIKEAAKRLFTVWTTSTKRKRARLTPKKIKVVGARLRQGYSVEDLEQCLKGFASSPWHSGANPRNKAYNDFSWCLQDGDKVEQGIGYYVDLVQRPAEEEAKRIQTEREEWEWNQREALRRAKALEERNKSISRWYRQDDCLEFSMEEVEEMVFGTDTEDGEGDRGT